MYSEKKDGEGRYVVRSPAEPAGRSRGEEPDGGAFPPPHRGQSESPYSHAPISGALPRKPSVTPGIWTPASMAEEPAVRRKSPAEALTKLGSEVRLLLRTNVPRRPPASTISPPSLLKEMLFTISALLPSPYSIPKPPLLKTVLLKTFEFEPYTTAMPVCRLLKTTLLYACVLSPPARIIPSLLEQANPLLYT